MQIEVSPRQAELVSYGVPSYEEASSQENVYQGQEGDAQGNDEQINEEAAKQEEVIQTTTNIEPSVEESTQDESEDEQHRLFREMFEKTFGVAPEVLKEELQTTRLEREKQAAEAELNRLKSDWGVDEGELSSRLMLIKERLEALPEASRAALDNYEGINILWNAIQHEKGSVQVPRYERSSTVNTASNKPMFTREQLKAMSPDEYRRNNDQILYAYQHGLVV